MPTQQIKFTIVWRKNVRLIWISNMEYIEADGNFTLVYLKDGTILRNEKSLKEVMENLTSFNYLRIHKSYAININHCSELDLSLNRRATMDSGTVLPVSRSRAREILAICKGNNTL